MGSIRRRGVLTAAVLVGALWVPASSLAAAPTITTGGVSNNSPTGAVLNGTVDPNGTATSYIFQYGTTRLYGASTPAQSAGGGNKPVRVSVAIGGLAPATTYHYRLVGLRGNRTFFGKNRNFKTQRQPLGVSLAATPNPVRVGNAVTLSGVLSGTGNGNRQVQLQANPWPYTGGFVAAGNNQVTDANGAFTFPILSLVFDTQYRVLMPTKPEVVSPVVVVGTTFKVTRHAKVFRGARRGRIHFWGTIRPALDRATVQIQKLRRGNWITIAETTARGTPRNVSRYSKRIRQKHGGRYRVVAIDPLSAHSPSASRSIRRHHLRF
jgi:hypothetical protein